MATTIVAPLCNLIQVLNLPKNYLNIARSVIKKGAPCQSQQIKGAITNPQGKKLLMILRRQLVDRIDKCTGMGRINLRGNTMPKVKDMA